jgi:hypothetical protein
MRFDYRTALTVRVEGFCFTHARDIGSYVWYETQKNISTHLSVPCFVVFVSAATDYWLAAGVRSEESTSTFLRMQTT